MDTESRQLLYVSNTRRGFGQDDLANILATARFRNAERDVTGMLLYLDGAFLQVLEGPGAAVEEIYQRIVKDKRHWDTQVLLDRIAPRAFSQWSMGFERLQADREGAFEATPALLKDKIDPGALKDLPALISTFYKINSGGYERSSL